MYEAEFRSIDETLWKDAGCSSELDYIEHTSWALFLRYLYEFVSEKETPAMQTGAGYIRIINDNHRLRNWPHSRSMAAI